MGGKLGISSSRVENFDSRIGGWGDLAADDYAVDPAYYDSSPERDDYSLSPESPGSLTLHAAPLSSLNSTG